MTNEKLLLQTQKEFATLLAIQETTSELQKTSSDRVLSYLSAFRKSWANMDSASRQSNDDKALVYGTLSTIKASEDSPIKDASTQGEFIVDSERLTAWLDTTSETLCELLDFEILENCTREDLLKGDTSSISYNLKDSLILTDAMIAQLALYFLDNVHFA